MTTCHSTVEKCPVWLCGVLAQIVVLRQTESSCNFSSLSSTFSFLCIIFFLILSPLLLCPSFLVWLWAVYLLFEIRVDICECYTETILWKYTACVYVHSSMTVFVCSLLMFVLFDLDWKYILFLIISRIAHLSTSHMKWGIFHVLCTKLYGASYILKFKPLS